MIGGKRWPSTNAWPRGWRSGYSLPIPTARGNAAPTRTRTGCCAVPAQGHGPVGLHAARAECQCPSPEHAPEKMSQLRHAPGSLCATAPSFTRCTWNLKPPHVKPVTVCTGLRPFLVPGREGECVVSMEIGRIMMFGLFSAVMLTRALG
jgi:hypothetical protein